MFVFFFVVFFHSVGWVCFFWFFFLFIGGWSVALLFVFFLCSVIFLLLGWLGGSVVCLGLAVWFLFCYSLDCCGVFFGFACSGWGCVRHFGSSKNCV